MKVILIHKGAWIMCKSQRIVKKWTYSCSQHAVQKQNIISAFGGLPCALFWSLHPPLETLLHLMHTLCTVVTNCIVFLNIMFVRFIIIIVYNFSLFLLYFKMWVLLLFRDGEANRSGDIYHRKDFVCYLKFPRRGRIPHDTGPQGE